MGPTKVKKKLKSGAVPTRKITKSSTRLKISKKQANEHLEEAQDSSSLNHIEEESDAVKGLVETTKPQPGTSQPHIIDYQKMYLALLAEHENLKKEHEALKIVMFGENGKFRLLELNVNQDNLNQESTN